MKPRMATAFELGVTAALVLTLVMVLVRVGEVSRLDLEMMTGALFTRSVGPVTWAIGSGVHLLAGGLFGMLYGRIFEAWGGAGWRRGMLVAVAHTLVSGTLLAVMPAIHPAVPEHPGLPAPGFMAAAYGPVTVAGFAAVHLLFGLLVGGCYPLHAPARDTPVSSQDPA